MTGGHWAALRIAAASRRYLRFVRREKIFRLSGGEEHGIVSPPGNRDTTEFPHHSFQGRVYECAVDG
jgi:hypothetical protein